MAGEHRTKRHGLKVRTEKSKGDLRSNFLRWRVMVIWNELPEEVAEPDMIEKL